MWIVSFEGSNNVLCSCIVDHPASTT